MLILTRRVAETLMIGDEISVTVVGVKGGQVRVGINAPRNIPVDREEIYERKKREQRMSQSRSSESPLGQSQGENLVPTNQQCDAAWRRGYMDGWRSVRPGAIPSIPTRPATHPPSSDPLSCFYALGRDRGRSEAR